MAPPVLFLLLVHLLLCLGPSLVSCAPCRVQEESRPGTVICNITQEVDFQTDSKQRPQFRLMKYTQYFRIDERTGVLRVRNSIDREVVCPVSEHERRVRCALDVRIAVFTNPEKPKFYPVQVEIEDINDNDPTFPRSKLVERVKENVPLGHEITLVKAKDPDAGAAGEIKYTLEGADKNFFSLDTTGINGDELKLKSLSTFDRETRASYHLTVVAADGGTPSQSGTLSVEIQIQDVNDHKPVFVSFDANIEVPEHDSKYIFTERQIGSFQAKDKDENSHVTFQLGKSADIDIGRTFSVNAQGVLHLIRPLNYDNKREYRVPIVAVDNGKPPASTTATVTVRVTDVNNHAPVIEFQGWGASVGGSSRLEVMENRPPLTFVATVTVYDRDQGINGEVSCRLNSASDFTLDPMSTDGREREYKLLTRVSFDREESAERHLVIVCEDHGAPERRSNTKSLPVHINDENDNGPSFYMSNLQASIYENEPAGSEVLRVVAKDPDQDENARVVYQLKKEYEGLFSIDSKTGRVHIKGPLDRETNKTVVFEVIAFDAKDRLKNATAKVTVRVEDRNDCSPIFEQNYTFTVAENELGSQVGRIRATDKDDGENGRITYSLQMKKSKHWRMSEDGLLFVANKLDREEQSEYSLVVQARDHGIPPRSTSTLVHIIVSDKNDHTPVFQLPSQANSSVNITADTKPGRVVARVSAQDLDDGENGRIEYALSRKLAFNTLFEINPQTGDIFLTKPIPSQVDQEYKLVVTATDHGEPRRVGYMVLSIRFLGGRRGRKGRMPRNKTFHDTEGPITREVLITFGIGLAVILMVVLAALILYFCHQTRGRQRGRPRHRACATGSNATQSGSGRCDLLQICPCLRKHEKATKEQPLYEEGVLTPMKKDPPGSPNNTQIPYPDGTMKRVDEYDTTFYTKIDPAANNADAASIYPYGQLAESELAGYSLYAPGGAQHVASSQSKTDSRASSQAAGPGSTGGGSNMGRFHALGSLDCLEAAAAAGAREKEIRVAGVSAKDDRRGSGSCREEKGPSGPPGGLEPPPGTLVTRKGRHNAGYSLRSPYLASSFV